MAQVASHVGMDVSKLFLDAYRHPSGARLRVSNDAAGWAVLAAWLEREPAGRVGMEASGGYERGVAQALVEAGHAVSLVEPRRVRRYAEAAGLRAKNDRIDAAVIARFTAQFCDRLVLFVPADGTLAELLGWRDALVEERTRVRNRSEHAQDPRHRRALAERLQALRQEVKQVERWIAAQLEADEATAKRAALLRSVPCIGPIATAALIAYLPELGRVSSKQVAALAGVAPYDQDSGGHKGAREIEGGRAALRRILYMAALIGVRRNPALSAFNAKLRAKGKLPKVALVAAMRKLVVILNAMLAKNEAWRPPAATAQSAG